MSLISAHVVGHFDQIHVGVTEIHRTSSGLLRHFFRLGRVRFDNVLHLFNGLVDLLYTLALVCGSRSNLLNAGIDLRDLGDNRIKGGEYLLKAIQFSDRGCKSGLK